MKINKEIVGLVFVCAFPLVIAGIYIKDEYVQSKEKSIFSYNCSLNKGIAVRDLDNKMRCVPMFSAKGRS